METHIPPSADVHFVRITSKNVIQVCKLSETLSPQQHIMVTDNAISIAESHCSENGWMRAIYAGDTLVGFLMLHIGSDFEDGIDCPGYFLWRFMIAGPYQCKGYGRQAMQRLIAQLRSQGVRELYTSCGQGEGSPEGFYRSFGFETTGEMYGDEIELLLKLDK